MNYYPNRPPQYRVQPVYNNPVYNVPVQPNYNVVQNPFVLTPTNVQTTNIVRAESTEFYPTHNRVLTPTKFHHSASPITVIESAEPQKPKEREVIRITEEERLEKVRVIGPDEREIFRDGVRFEELKTF